MDTEITLTAELTLTLMEEKRLQELRALANDMPPEDLVELFYRIPKQYYGRLFRILHKELAAEVFTEMEPEEQELLISSFTDAQLRELLSEMFYDDTVDLIEEMPANVVQRVLANSSAEDRRVINELLRYPADSAGGNMTTEFVRLEKDMTVAEALRVIRRVGVNKETVYTCYVTDRNRHLIGIVGAKDLLLSDDETVIADIMEERIISVGTLDHQEEAAQTMSKYALMALPVVDTENRLVGIVTIDDAVEILQDEAEEDFSIMAAMTPNETPYLRTSTLSIWLRRFPWLAILMLSSTFTGIIIASFESALAQVVVLTTFIPMLMGTGGNSGSQASVTVIRSLSTGELKLSQWLHVVWKETRVALFCGLTLSVLAFAKVWLIDRLLMQNDAVDLHVALVVSLTLCVTVVIAKLIGCTLPILAERVGLDPAVVASPFITTIVDAVSLLVYFGIACSVIPALTA